MLLNLRPDNEMISGANRRGSGVERSFE